MDYPTLIQDLPEDDYHARPEYGSTQVRAALRSINHFKLACEPTEQTKSMRLGTAIHCAVLEPQRFEDLYLASKPPIDPGDLYYRKRETAEMLAAGLTIPDIADELDVKEETVDGYAEDDEVQALRVHYVNHPPDETPDLSDSQIEKVLRIRDRVRAHPEARLILEEGRPEVSAFAELDGVACKGRFDWYADGCIWDLKTTSKPASRDSVRKLIAWRDYHVQAGLYTAIDGEVRDGVLPEFGWLFVETQPPHNVGVYRCGRDTLEEGRELMFRALEIIAEYESDPHCFGGYCDILEIVNIPGWAFRATESDDDVDEEPVPEVPF